MLCNKSDINDSKDEVHIVNALQVEKLVNASKCPTRVEPCVANKNQVWLKYFVKLTGIDWNLNK